MTELAHHGILGQKWGVRRFQNKDGSLTAAGKQRLEKQDRTEKSSAKLQKTKAVIDAGTNLVNAGKKLNSDTKRVLHKQDLSRMTDQELRQKINRALMEKQYSELYGQEAKVSKGRQYVNKTLNACGNVLAVGSSVVGLAVAIKELRK